MAKTKTPKTGKGDIRKLKAQYPFLYFVAHNGCAQQTKDVLCLDLTKEQYTVLRELAVNELANNLPSYSTPKKKKELKTKNIVRLKKLAGGHLRHKNLAPLFPLLRLICSDAIAHHDLQGEKTRGGAARGLAEDGQGRQG